MAGSGLARDFWTPVLFWCAESYPIVYCKVNTEHPHCILSSAPERERQRRFHIHVSSVICIMRTLCPFPVSLTFTSPLMRAFLCAVKMHKLSPQAWEHVWGIFLLRFYWVKGIHSEGNASWLRFLWETPGFKTEDTTKLLIKRILIKRLRRCAEQQALYND